jgi:uncharacterized membrane protein
MRDLGIFGGSSSAAAGINEAGQAVGQHLSLVAPHAFIAGPNGEGMTDQFIGRPAGWDYSN